jgi:hypothetical protein
MMCISQFTELLVVHDRCIPVVLTLCVYTVSLQDSCHFCFCSECCKIRPTYVPHFFSMDTIVILKHIMQTRYAHFLNKQVKHVNP